MMEALRKIVAVFLKTDPQNITAGTVIDRSAIPGSIWIHRMYAVISRELGRDIVFRPEWRTFADLVRGVGLEGRGAVSSQGVQSPQRDVLTQVDLDAMVPSAGLPLSVGIDLEDIASLPEITSGAEDPFYQQNFSPAEIAYCLAQPVPRQSLAGLFAAKEAIVKADNRYRQEAFARIDIRHTAEGQPFFADFALSITHTAGQAMAIAIRIKTGAAE